MAIVIAGNTVFVRHLSPQVSESILRKAFAQCDSIERVLFRAFPGRSTEYYAQIDFNSSKGVVEASKMSGTPILGVVCQVSVVDPGSSDLLRKVMDTRKNNAAPEEPERPHIAEPQGVQAEYIRKYREQAEVKRLKTVHVSGIEDKDSEEGLRALCAKFGVVEAMRMDKDAEGKPFALVEFKELGPATVVRSRQGFVVDGRTIVFTEAKTLVDTNSYVERSVHFMSPYFDPSELLARGAQSHLTDKIARARLAAAEIMNEPPTASAKPAEEQAATPEEPVNWEGRSEKDYLRELAALSRRPPEREREQGRRRCRRRQPGSPSATGQRRRESRSGSPDKDRRKRRRGPSRKRSCDRRRRRTDREKAQAPPAEGERDAQLDEEPLPETYDAEDPELAVVPNTELLVLGESSSYSSGSVSPQRGGAAVPPTQGHADGRRQVDHAGEVLGRCKDGSGSPGALVRPSPGGEQKNAPEASPKASEPAPAKGKVDADEAAGEGAVGQADQGEGGRIGVMDVDEKEQWLPAVDVDEEGSCDEIIVARDGDSSPESVVAEAALAGGGDAAPALGSPVGGSGGPRRGLAHSASDLAAPRGELATEESAASLPGNGAAASPNPSSPSRPPARTETVAAAVAATAAAPTAPSARPPTASPSPASERWECDACGEVNKNKRDQCNNCGGNAPWITVKSPHGDDVDELSSASSPSSPSSVGESPAKSVRDVAESPARSVGESPPRSVAASGSARSVAESNPQSLTDLEDSGSEANAGCVDVSEEEADECTLEAERVRGEVADARARIFHSAA